LIRSLVSFVSRGWLLAEKYQTEQSGGDSNKAGSSKENGGSGSGSGSGGGGGATTSLGLETANKVLRAKLDILNREIDEYRSESIRRVSLS